MVGSLEGQTGIVTGVGTELGEAIAKRLAKAGARVVPACLNASRAHAVAEAIEKAGGNAHAFSGDYSTPLGVELLVTEALDHYGRVDFVVHHAGVFRAMSALDEYPLDAFDALHRVGPRASFLLARAALPELRKTEGALIFTGTREPPMMPRHRAVHDASRSWLEAFVIGLAEDEGADGAKVRVHAFPESLQTLSLDTLVGVLAREAPRRIVRRDVPELARTVDADAEDAPLPRPPTTREAPRYAPAITPLHTVTPPKPAPQPTATPMTRPPPAPPAFAPPAPRESAAPSMAPKPPAPATSRYDAPRPALRNPMASLFESLRHSAPPSKPEARPAPAWADREPIEAFTPVPEAESAPKPAPKPATRPAETTFTVVSNRERDVE